MTIKLFEIRDRATTIPAMAVRLRNRDEAEFFLLRRAGYSAEQVGGRQPGIALHCTVCGYHIEASIAERLLAKNSGGVQCPNHRDNPTIMAPVEGEKDSAVQEPYVVLWRLEGGPAEYDPYAWGNRTMANAHRFIVEHWRALKSGDVVDVEYLLGETKAPKLSERLTEVR